MLRAAAVALVIMIGACEEHGSGGPGTPDAAGSGSAAFETESSPQDGTLSMIVVGLTALVVVGAGRSRRREQRVDP